jgi:soluble lytic murein transglycosylase-like protein
MFSILALAAVAAGVFGFERGIALAGIALDGGSAPPAALSETVPAPPPDPLAALPAVDLERAAAALRRRDCSAAGAALDPHAAGAAAPAALARTLQGLYAHACEDPQRAEERLVAGAGGGRLEDWRLFALADAAAARNHQPVALAALDSLLSGHPGSPLRPRALLRAAELARGAGDRQAALEQVARARAERLTGEAAVGLEVLAWEIGAELGDFGILSAAARRLLAAAPHEARRLGIEDASPGGGPYLALLGVAELAERAESFLAAGDPTGALRALDRVPDALRERSWMLLAARALTAARRGGDAVARLSGLTGATAAGEAEIEWARAQGLLDAAAVVRGRTNLPSAERARLRGEARRHLAAAAAADPAGPRAVPALRRLYAEVSEDGTFEQELAVLRMLRAADPADETGAERLWELGWREYRRGNATGAIGYWTELAGLYPGHRHDRAGRYWTARAFERLGERERADRLYAEVASVDTTDFYRRHALARLASRGPGAAPATDPERREPPEPWPADPALERVRLLTDLGLDGLALSELEAVAAGAPPRAAAALEALVLARQGRRRDSIPRIRAAFPALGSSNQAGVPEEALRLYYPIDYGDLIRGHAERNRLPLHLVLGMIRQESAFDVGAQSWAGARGLMQVMPATGREVAKKLGVPWSTARLGDPDYNVRLGTTYFRQVLSMFGGDVELALAGYNGGPYRIQRLWREGGSSQGLDTFLEGLGIPESRTYVKRILLLTDSYEQLYPAGEVY